MDLDKDQLPSTSQSSATVAKKRSRGPTNAPKAKRKPAAAKDSTKGAKPEAKRTMAWIYTGNAKPTDAPKAKRKPAAAKKSTTGAKPKRTMAWVYTGNAKPKGNASKPKPRGRKGKVEELLRSRGVKNPETVSKCLMAAISRGHVKILTPEKDPENQYGLDQVFVESDCFVCGEEVLCTVRDVLYQPDCGGMDYEDGGLDAPLKCKDSDCAVGIYVTSMCEGQPTFDSGKFHNHCTACSGYGECIGDYREAHCENCNHHYFRGGAGLPCHNCGGRDGFFGEDSSDEDGEAV